MGKALFRSEESTFKAHLYPHQLALSVSGGAEVMPHLSRGWLSQHSDDLHRVLLDMDESNARNEVERHTFLSRLRQVAPRARMTSPSAVLL